MNRFRKTLLVPILAIFVLGCSPAENKDCVQVAETRYKGEINNTTVGIKTSIDVTLEQSRCKLTGMMLIDKPLIGSGPISGSVVKDEVFFKIDKRDSDAGVDIIFTGTISETGIKGTYQAPERGQSGVWNIASEARVRKLAEELFWIAADVARIPRGTPFDTAKRQLEDVLFNEYDIRLTKIEKVLTSSPFDTWPYCINATSGAIGLAGLGLSNSAYEAAPFANRAIDAIKGLDADYLDAKELRSGYLPYTESKERCEQLESEIRESVGWPPAQR